MAGDVLTTPDFTPKTRFRGARAVAALMLREMATTYGRSPGGVFVGVAGADRGASAADNTFFSSFSLSAFGQQLCALLCHGLPALHALQRGGCESRSVDPLF